MLAIFALALHFFLTEYDHDMHAGACDAGAASRQLDANARQRMLTLDHAAARCHAQQTFDHIDIVMFSMPLFTFVHFFADKFVKHSHQ